MSARRIVAWAAALLLAGAAPAAAVRVEPVAFKIANVNGSDVPCPADGSSYYVHGSLVAPGGPLPRSVTLYLHGLSYGEFFFRFGAVPGYDAAIELARAGHASVVVDRLGYRSSSGPAGGGVCVGSQADVAHQIVEQLRSRFGFKRVALVGHSAGGLIAQIEAYSFGGVDALGVLSYADSGSSPLVLQTAADTTARCLTPGSSGFEYFGATEDDFKAGHVHDMDPTVLAALLKLRTRDPCGDIESLGQAVAVDQALTRSITVPVLVLIGDHDAFFPPPAADQQQGAYGSSDVTSVTLAGTGHAVALGRSAPAFRAALSAWLAKRGL